MRLRRTKGYKKLRRRHKVIGWGQNKWKMPLKERTMKHLLNAGWPEYKGTARVQYDLISFHSKKRKFLLRRDVEFWEEKLAQLKGDQDQVVYAPIVMVSQEALQKAEKQIPSQYNSQEIPTLVFQEGELLCLDGHSRIEAAKNSILLQGSTGFGIVHIVLDGFSSDLIEFRSADYMSCHEDRSVTLHPSDWTDFPNVKVKQRLGQKGNRWSEKSNSARKYLFFDIAETVGTEVAQQVQKQKDVTTLVELACIYRAFFGDPFFPSAYAKLPHASEATCLSSPTSTYPEGSYLSLSSLAPHGKGDGEIDSLSYDDWREPDHVLPSEPFEQLKEAYTQTARDTSKQPCGLIENNDHAYESSTSGYSSCVECEVGGRHLNESSTSGYSSCVECEVGGRHLNESSTSGYSSCVECEVGGRHPDGSSPLNRGVPMTPYVGGNTPIPRLDSSSIENLDHNWDGNNTLAPLSLLLTAKDACASSQSSRGLTDQNPKYIRPLNSATDSKGRVIADYKRTHGRINVNDDYGRTETIVTSSPTSLPLQPAKVRTRLDRQPAADKPIDETADKDRLKAQVVGGQTFCALDQAGEAGQRQQMYLQGRKEGRESEEEKPPSQCDLNKGIPTGSPVLSLQLGDDEHYQRSMSLFSAESYNDEDEGQIFDTNVVSSPVNPGELQREKEFEGEGRLLSTGTLPHNALRQAGTKADTTQTSTHDPGRAPPARERPLTAETSHITPVRSQTVPPRQEQAKGAQALDPVSSSNPVFCNISPRTRTRSRGNMENTLVSPGLVGAGNERSLQAPQQKNHFNNTKLNEQPHTKTTVKRLPQGQLAQDGSLRQTQVPQPGRQVDGMEATTHTKWQQPSVEDLDEAGSECIKTPVDGLVGNSPKSVSFDIYAEPAVPTTPQFAEKAQSNGASRGNRMSTCPSIRRSVTGLAALEKNGSPTIAADKWCLEEHIASRMAHSNGTKRRKSRSKHYGMNKRPCIELSVAGRLGKKPTKIMIRQRRARAEAEGNQLYGSRALATAEEMVRFSKESIVLQSEKTWTEPVSQLPLRTGPVQKSVETAATSQEPNKVHGKRWKPRRSKFETNKRPCIELPAVRHLGELSESVSRTGLGRGQIYGLQAEAATEEMTAFLERSKRSKLPQAENNSAEPLPRQCRNSSEFPTTGPLRESVETSAASQEPNKVYGNRWKSRRSKFETNKRPCIELPAVRHLGKLPESVSRTGLGRGQIYGLQAEAATEKMTSFLECSKRPKVPQSENKTTEPVSQQCRNRTVPPRTGPVREPVETPSVSESLGKGHEKRRNTGISEYTTNKRPCIEYPVPRPVDAISARASQRPVREQASSSGKGLVYGLQAVAATEKMTAFLKRSRVPQSKNNSTEPVSQQCRNRMEPSRTGPIQKPFPARGQYKDAGKRGKSREPDLKINKRPCIEYPVPRPVDATSAKTFQRPVRKQASSSGKGLVYGLQAVAATEKMTAFLKRSRVPQSEKDSIDSVSQQFRAHTELPRTRPSPEHAERTNSPQNSSKKYSAVVNDQLDLVTPPPHQAPNAESMASALPQQRPECSQLGQHRHDSSSTGRSTHVGSRQGANGSPGALSNPKALKNEGNALEPNTKTTRFSDTPHTGTSKGIRSHAMHSLPDGGPDNARLQPSPRRASPKASRGRARAMAQIKKTKKYPKKADYAHWINTFAFIVELKGEQNGIFGNKARPAIFSTKVYGSLN
ncbi:hypothetical protein PENANT_c099G10063 [Penicillium antarcticum]|uniref:Uncharacterized protein n=1 Tax=Penicillium antarcticum TaxID=416450 RepID=A0A1V6PMN5_9EURO|nr:hypothetical protein PENANT_c099G10063 [Penicillium antarcticum]